MYKLAIFDLDGTILDTINDLNKALCYTLAEYNLPKISVDETKKNLGNGIRNLIMVSGKLDNCPDEMFNTFMTYYNNNVNNYTKPYDGIIDLLNELKNAGYKLAVISNKNIKPLNLLIDAHFKNIFDLVLGEGMGFPKKPNPEIVLYCINRLGIDIKDTVYIGDSDVDIKTVNNVRCDGLYVSYGYRSKEKLVEAGAKIIFENVQNLKDYLLNYNCI